MIHLKTLAKSLGMNCLVEIHDKTELEIALKVGAEIIGINNRDLRTFTTDLNVTEELAPLIPNSKIIVSESGISNYSHIERVSKLGVNAVLVGEALVTSQDISRAVKTLTGQNVHDVNP
jgi:indole-3-glycerol phosphate synthase